MPSCNLAVHRMAENGLLGVKCEAKEGKIWEESACRSVWWLFGRQSSTVKIFNSQTLRTSNLCFHYSWWFLFLPSYFKFPNLDIVHFFFPVNMEDKHITIYMAV